MLLFECLLLFSFLWTAWSAEKLANNYLSDFCPFALWNGVTSVIFSLSDKTPVSIDIFVIRIFGSKISSFTVFRIFFLIWRTRVLFVCNDTPGLDFFSGFQSHSGQPYSHLVEAYMMYIHLWCNTSWQPAWGLVTVPHMPDLNSRPPI